MNPDGITAGSSLRRTIELDDMPDRDYFRHTAGELLSDTDDEWKWPDLTDKQLDSTGILNALLPKLEDKRRDPKYKMNFWTTYRKCIKKVLNDHRSNSREKMKKHVLEGKV